MAKAALLAARPGSFELDSGPASTKYDSMAVGPLPDQFVSMRTT